MTDEPTRARETAPDNYGTYRARPEHERWELIRGEAHAMAPAPGLGHQIVLRELLTQLNTQLRGRRCQVFCAPFDVRLPESDEEDDEIKSVVQPDLFVVCDPRKLDPKGCRGAPDWVIEILSPGNAARDQIEKLALYEQHGVAEYWLVHPVDRVVTCYLLGKDGVYGRPHIEEARGRSSPESVVELVIDWDPVFEQLL